jgi:acylphosphatase
VSSGLRIIVRGRVQGVGFRAWTVDMARTLTLAGWVRNRHDGSVEILVAGDRPALHRFTEACRHGPPGAVVTDLETSEAESPDGSAFMQIETR